VHYLSQHATEAYENARKYVKQYINAGEAHEIIFTRGTTESINLVASSLGRLLVEQGDEILISQMEHHSNIVPWQMLAKEKNAHLKIIPINDEGEIEVGSLNSLITDRTRIVSLTHISNVLGTINPVKHVIDLAHERDIPVIIDGAQAIPHMLVDVQELDCDFYCFSGHKAYGPMGIGVLYGKEKWLDRMPPYQGGGEMVDQVTFMETTFNDLPFKFEAGTPNVVGVLGLETALNYLDDLDIKQISSYEQELLTYATVELLKIDGLRIIGTSENKASVISFIIEGIHPYDAGTIIDKFGVAVRTGHHCAQPVIDRFELPGTIRASFGLYNTLNDIDRLIEAIMQAKKMLL
jgi:cysteine desulfurase/selenocysteine lyase